MPTINQSFYRKTLVYFVFWCIWYSYMRALNLGSSFYHFQLKRCNHNSTEFELVISSLGIKFQIVLL